MHFLKRSKRSVNHTEGAPVVRLLFRCPGLSGQECKSIPRVGLTLTTTECSSFDRLKKATDEAGWVLVAGATPDGMECWEPMCNLCGRQFVAILLQQARDTHADQVVIDDLNMIRDRLMQNDA